MSKSTKAKENLIDLLTSKGLQQDRFGHFKFVSAKTGREYRFKISKISWRFEVKSIGWVRVKSGYYTEGNEVVLGIYNIHRSI